MTERTFTYRYNESGADIEETFTVENETWNKSVAKQYAAYHIEEVLGLTVFDVGEIEIVDL